MYYLGRYRVKKECKEKKLFHQLSQYKKGKSPTNLTWNKSFEYIFLWDIFLLRLLVIWLCRTILMGGGILCIYLCSWFLCIRLINIDFIGYVMTIQIVCIIADGWVAMWVVKVTLVVVAVDKAMLVWWVIVLPIYVAIAAILVFFVILIQFVSLLLHPQRHVMMLYYRRLIHKCLLEERTSNSAAALKLFLFIIWLI